MSSRENDVKNTAIVALTKNGAVLADQLGKHLTDALLYLPSRFAGSSYSSKIITYTTPLKSLIADIFTKYKYLILIMATGVAVRAIAPLIQSKYSDPGVVVIDEKGKFAISLLSGHLGGANALTRRISQYLKSQPVITTASDISNGMAIDLLGAEYGWEIENRASLKTVSACLVNGEPVAVYQDTGETDWLKHACKAQPNLKLVKEAKELESAEYKARIIISDRILPQSNIDYNSTVVFRPKSLVVGIGCNRGTKETVIKKALYSVLQMHNLSFQSIRNFATVELKQDEKGLLRLSSKLNIPVQFYGSAELRRTEVPSPRSEMVMQHTGTPSVCEAAAILSSENGELIVKKTSFFSSVSIAVARVKYSHKIGLQQGKIYLVGLGPGSTDVMTFRAKEVLETCDVIVGYKKYIQQIQNLIDNKVVFSTGMGREIERAEKAIELAQSGENVAVVCSGDTGIYGMASVVAEIMAHRHLILDMEVVPGVPAFVASSALLGAPLNNDFACISLSDYLVSSEAILQRIEAAVKSDFIIVLYNPASNKRKTLLPRVRDIILQFRTASTPVGIVQNAFRPEEKVIITDLISLCEHPVDMNTILIIGNSNTFNYHKWMVTARGYLKKYSLDSEKCYAVNT